MSKQLQRAVVRSMSVEQLRVLGEWLIEAANEEYSDGSFVTSQMLDRALEEATA